MHSIPLLYKLYKTIPPGGILYSSKEQMILTSKDVCVYDDQPFRDGPLPWDF